MINFKIDELIKLEKELGYLQSHVLRVGVLGGKGMGKIRNDIELIQEYAAYHEYGAPQKRIPPRPFFRQSVLDDKSQKEIYRYMNNKLKLVFNGEITGEQYLNIIGIYIIKRIRNKIKNGNWIPNSKKTLENKKGSNPLIDTRSLINSISFEIVGV